MRRSRYCAGPHLRLSRWLFAARGAVVSTWPQLEGRHVIRTFRGRSAIYLAVSALGLKSGDEILVPAYNCGTELDALLAAGARLSPYRITSRCSIDLADLQSRVTPATRAVYVIHYFGWDDRLADLRTWCDARGLRLIEDCALALFSSGQSGQLGRLGDASIFSLPKTIGCEHGGLLSLRKAPSPALPEPLRAASLWSEVRKSAQAAALHALDTVGCYGGVLQARRARPRRVVAHSGAELEEMPRTYRFDPDADLRRGMDERLWSAAQTLPVDAVVEARRRHYRELAGALQHVPGLELLFSELSDGVCPLSLPILFTHRDALVAGLQARGIAALPWWAGFHRQALAWDRFPNAIHLKRHVLTLPVQPALTPQHLEYIVTTTTEVARSLAA